MSQNILVVAVHPDDETLGCGGTILKHKASGDKVTWCIVTNMTLNQGWAANVVSDRQKEIDVVSKNYPFDDVIEMQVPTTQVDGLPLSTLARLFMEVLNRVKPSVVYLPFNWDAHSDHRICFQAFIQCVKTFRYPFIRKVYMMETLSETDYPAAPEAAFAPNYFVDISEYMDRKLEILGVYASELGKHPFPRSKENVRALAHLRGATSGCNYAESFMLVKEIWS